MITVVLVNNWQLSSIHKNHSTALKWNLIENIFLFFVWLCCPATCPQTFSPYPYYSVKMVVGFYNIYFINTTLYEKWYNKVMLEHYIRKFYLHKDMSCVYFGNFIQLHKSSQSHTRYNRILTGWRNWVKNMFVNSKIDVKSPLWHFSSPVCKIATEHKYLNHDSR